MVGTSQNLIFWLATGLRREKEKKNSAYQLPIYDAKDANSEITRPTPIAPALGSGKMDVSMCMFACSSL